MGFRLFCSFENFDLGVVYCYAEARVSCCEFNVSTKFDVCVVLLLLLTGSGSFGVVLGGGF